MTNLVTRGLGGEGVNLSIFGLGAIAEDEITKVGGGGGATKRREITTVLRGFPVEPFKDGFEEFEQVALEIEEKAREAVKTAEIVKLELKPGVLTKAQNAELTRLLRAEETKAQVDKELQFLLQQVEAREAQRFEDELLLLSDENEIAAIYAVVKKLKKRVF